ncbi:Tn3 family transposase [Pseudovibrio denitrificans]|uniref:Tn3 family transposase n=1 Tax=Pseudovibrio denitrificans TaxID=258256 RepID=UPI0039BF1973
MKPLRTLEQVRRAKNKIFLLNICLLMNEREQKINEQYVDIGSFTDHVFAVSALLSYSFISRIRDLLFKRF